MSAKPIFTVGLPTSRLSMSDMDEISKTLETKMPDYYILVYGVSEEDVKFDCFYEKDLKEVDFEELKEIVRNFNPKE